MSADTTTEGRESTQSNSTGVYGTGTTLANPTPTTLHSVYPRGGEDTDAKGAASSRRQWTKESSGRNWLWQQHHKSSSITVNILFTLVVYLNEAHYHPRHHLFVALLRPLTRSAMVSQLHHSSIEPRRTISGRTGLTGQYNNNSSGGVQWIRGDWRSTTKWFCFYSPLKPITAFTVHGITIICSSSMDTPDCPIEIRVIPGQGSISY